MSEVYCTTSNCETRGKKSVVANPKCDSCGKNNWEDVVYVCKENSHRKRNPNDKIACQCGSTFRVGIITSKGNLKLIEQSGFHDKGDTIKL